MKEQKKKKRKTPLKKKPNMNVPVAKENLPQKNIKSLTNAQIAEALKQKDSEIKGLQLGLNGVTEKIDALLAEQRKAAEELKSMLTSPIPGAGETPTPAPGGKISPEAIELLKVLKGFREGDSKPVVDPFYEMWKEDMEKAYKEKVRESLETSRILNEKLKKAKINFE